MGSELELLHWINQPGDPTVDAVMIALSSRYLLIPLAFGAALVLWLRARAGWRSALALGLSIVAADAVSARIFKPAFARVRPCGEHPPRSVAPQGCSGSPSFPSSHATNAAAAATVLAAGAPAWAALGVALALAIGISRVYLGVHWPGDVAGGWVLGVAIATAVLWLIRWLLPKPAK
jgi:undecaprenyl-diphosphatase